MKNSTNNIGDLEFSADKLGMSEQADSGAFSPLERRSMALGRRNLLCAFAAMGTIAAAPYYAKAAGYVKGSGDIRKLQMRNDRTGEVLDLIYWVEGNYVKASLKAINYFFRDWRAGKAMDIDLGELDIIAASHRLLDTSEPYILVSGYRTAATNRRLPGTARNSYHVMGRAADLRLASRSVKQVAGAARRLGAGGVGAYYRSDFVHLDSGPIRNWQR